MGCPKPSGMGVSRRFGHHTPQKQGSFRSASESAGGKVTCRIVERIRPSHSVSRFRSTSTGPARRAEVRPGVPSAAPSTTPGTAPSGHRLKDGVPTVPLHHPELQFRATTARRPLGHTGYDSQGPTMVCGFPFKSDSHCFAQFFLASTHFGNSALRNSATSIRYRALAALFALLPASLDFGTTEHGARLWSCERTRVRNRK